MALDVTYDDGSFADFNLGMKAPNEPFYLAFTAVLDINGDGFEDLLMTTHHKANVSVDPAPVKVLISDGTQLVDRTEDYLPGVGGMVVSRGVFVADFNGDGAADVYVYAHGSEAAPTRPGEQNRLFLSDGAGGLDDATATHLPALVAGTHGAGVGDFDGDGDVDIFNNTLGYNGVDGHLMLNDGEGHLSVADYFHSGVDGWFPNDLGEPGGGALYFAHAFDMNGDGLSDVWTSGVSRTNLPGEIDYRGLISDGEHLDFSDEIGAFPELDDPANEVGEWADDADLDRDGDLDLVVWVTAPSGVRRFQILINDGAGNFSDEAVERGVSPEPFVPGYTSLVTMSLADLDGDGDDDIVAPCLNETTFQPYLVVYLNQGDGTFELVPDEALPNVRASVLFVDVDGDGIKDMLVDDMWDGGDIEEQFIFFKASLDVAVTRTGWGTDDRIFGGSKGDVLRGLGGDDRLQGNAGADTLRGGEGDDMLIGRSGADIADYAERTAAVTASLSAAGGPSVKVGGVKEDTLVSIEGLAGGKAGDALTGDAGANRLTGNGGDDVLKGKGGKDVLTGGAGRDTLEGGGAGDAYVFASVNHMAKGAGRDVVKGFSRAERDRIDLSGIDADQRAANPGNDKFVYIGTKSFAAYHATHEKVFGMVRKAADGVFQLNVDGKLGVDAEIKITGFTSLAKDDFLL